MPTIPSLFRSQFKIIDRYLLREFVFSLLGVLSVLWLIFIATRFARYLSQASVGNLPSEVIFTLLGYSSLGALSILLPMAAFLAVMLALGRMNSDTELAAMSACGVPQSQLIKNVLIFSGSVAVCVGALSLYIIPSVLTESYNIEQRSKMAADTSGLIAGNFKESRDGTWTFYSQSLTDDKQGMENVFIEIHKSEKPMVFRAKQGHFEIDPRNGNKYLVLEDGYRYQGEAGDQDFIIAHFESHNMLIEKGGEQQIRERHKALPTGELWQRGTSGDFAEIQWRFSSVLMTMILCLLAVKIANSGPRKGRYAGFFPAILVYVIYSNLLGVTRSWVSKGSIDPWLGATWVHILMLVFLYILFNRYKVSQFVNRVMRVKG
jgi:lipopolysaccharide export system permease protein